jgi:hypothetical protein
VDVARVRGESDLATQPRPGTIEESNLAAAPQSPNKTEEASTTEPQQPKINWDDSNMKSSYANVCNAIGTREEVVLFFGISNPTQSTDADVSVDLSQRVILSPFAARRLATMLTNVLQQYETRWGKLEQGAAAASTTTKN